jgi:hypothetical protein
LSSSGCELETICPKVFFSCRYYQGNSQGGEKLARSNYKFEKRQKELAKKKKKEEKRQLKIEKNTIGAEENPTQVLDQGENLQE